MFLLRWWLIINFYKYLWCLGKHLFKIYCIFTFIVLNMLNRLSSKITKEIQWIRICICIIIRSNICIIYLRFGRILRKSCSPKLIYICLLLRSWLSGHGSERIFRIKSIVNCVINLFLRYVGGIIFSKRIFL